MPKRCFATVTDEGFAVAAEVLIYSFIQFNPWFDSDIVVVEVGELLPKTKQRLEAIYPINFVSPSSQLLDKLDELQSEITWLEKKRAHFHVFELFRLCDYEQIVYIDGDTYCRGDLTELFTQDDQLQACPDGFNLRTQLWNKLGDLAPEKLPEAAPYGAGIKQSFNSGVLVLGQKQISMQSYKDMLALLNPDIYQHSDFGDQMAFNIQFNDNYKAISCRYNYMILVEEYIKGLEEISSLDARIIHFAGKIKPWYRYKRQDLYALAPQYVKYIDEWHELYYTCRHKGDLALTADKVKEQRKWQRENLQKFDALKQDSML